MDHFERLQRDTKIYIGVLVAIENVLVFGIWWLLQAVVGLPGVVALVAALILATGLIVGVASLVSSYALQPLRALWQSVLHLSPTEHGIDAPNLEDLKTGRELVTSLVAQIHQMANVAAEAANENQQLSRDISRNFVAQNLP